jgi:hypothetical protein
MGCNGYKTKQEVKNDLLTMNAPSPAPIAIGVEPGTICIALLTLLLFLEMI